MAVGTPLGAGPRAGTSEAGPPAGGSHLRQPRALLPPRASLCAALVLAEPTACYGERRPCGRRQRRACRALGSRGGSGASMGCSSSCELGGPRVTASELFAAAAAGDVDTGMKALLMDGVRVSVADTNGWCGACALHCAAALAAPGAAPRRCDLRAAPPASCTWRAARQRGRRAADALCACADKCAVAPLQDRAAPRRATRPRAVCQDVAAAGRRSQSAKQCACAPRAACCAHRVQAYAAPAPAHAAAAAERGHRHVAGAVRRDARRAEAGRGATTCVTRSASAQVAQVGCSSRRAATPHTVRGSRGCLELQSAAFH